MDFDASSQCLAPVYGVCFGNQKACTKAVRAFAASQGKGIYLDPKAQGGAFLRYKCSGGEHCKFEVTATRSQAANQTGYVISTSSLNHTMCGGRLQIGATQLREYELIRSLVAANSAVSGKVIVQQVKAGIGAVIPLKEAYRGKNLILDDLFGSVEDGFRRLRSLLEIWSVNNPTSVTCSDWNENGEFVRAFVSHPFAYHYAEHGQKVVGIDGAFIKHGKFKSTQLILVGRDGNSMNIVLAVAVCASESEENLLWFFHCCTRAGIRLSEMPIFSDRGSGILAALHTLDWQNVRFCTRHIMQNINKNFKGNCPREMTKILYEIQSSECEALYQMRITCLRMTHPAIADYIEDILPQNWVLYSALRSTRLYGWRSTNFVESQNAAAVSSRLLLPFGFFQSYMTKFMTESWNRRQMAKQWTKEGQLLTKYAHDLLGEEQSKAAYYNAVPSDDNLVFVHNTRGRTIVNRRVDLTSRSCTCIMFDQHGIPCHHFIAALEYHGKSEEMFSSVDHYYTTESFLTLYGASESNPIELVLSEQLTTNLNDHPPPIVSKPGRTKQRRYPSSGDPSHHVGRLQRLPKCGSCGQSGHNKRSCAKP
jgi:hypothetical protein